MTTGPSGDTAEALPVLDRLARTEATGVLLSEVGAVYVVRGEVVHAESPVSPTFEELLAGAGRLSADAWRAAVERGGRRREVARALLEAGQLTRGELEICHLGALFDAACFALAPDSGEAHFRAGVGHWLGTIRPVPAATVCREAVRRRRLLDPLWGCSSRPYAAPVRASEAARTVCRGGVGAGPSVPPRQLPVLTAVDDRRTATDIARRLGRPTFHVLLDVRRLTAAGYLREPRYPTQYPAQRPSPDTDTGDATGPAGAAPAIRSGPEPDIALLRRLRAALEEKL